MEVKEEKKNYNKEYPNNFVKPIFLKTAHDLRIESRCVMSKNRVFNFYETGDWSLDSTYQNQK